MLASPHRAMRSQELGLVDGVFTEVWASFLFLFLPFEMEVHGRYHGGWQTINEV